MKWRDRVVTADEWDRLDEQHGEAYDKIAAQVTEELRQEWEAEFGANNPAFPFRPSAIKIHREVMRRLNDSC